MPERALKSVASSHHLTPRQVQRILELLDAGSSVPYVLRYHKELAGNLSTDDLYQLIEERDSQERLESRRRKILRKLREREVLTDALEQSILQAADMRELIDYYVPYRPRKRSRSRLALSQGLNPLAAEVLRQETRIPEMGLAAEQYVNPDGGVTSIEEVLEGVFHIVCDWVAEEKSHRDRQRHAFMAEADISVFRAARTLPGRLVREYKPYFSFTHKVAKLHPYHALVIMRGRRSKALNYEVRPPVDAMRRVAAELYLAGGASQFEQALSDLGELASTTAGSDLKRLSGLEFLVVCVENSLRNILSGIMVREVEKRLADDAQRLALSIIRRNVRSLLMVQPVRLRVMGVHPGYRTGCNLAVLEGDGSVIETTTVYPHAPQAERAQAVEAICELVGRHSVKTFALGEATAAEETQDLFAEIIGTRLPELRYAVVSEVGLDTYSTSRGAKNDLPDVQPSERIAVAVARRLLDPLSEYVKVNPRQLCPEPYADDVNGGDLKTALDRTLQECVCAVGVDVNAAHHSLLRHVSGLDPDKALEVVAHREKVGPITDRAQLQQIPKIDETTYEQAAGFLRVQASPNPLDVTRIHPRLYPVAEQICSQVGMPLADLATEEGRARLRDQRSDIKLTELEKAHDVHYLLLKDLIDELVAPWPDPRASGPAPELRQKRPALEDLQPNQWVEGTVRNIVDFGVFVDIGVGEDGLIHISELSEGYVETPYDVVCVGDRLRVRVVRVDEERSRIALSLREHSPRRERPQRPARQRERVDRSRGEEAAVHAEVDVPSRGPGGGVRTPRSTLGMDSRRVQKATVTDKLSKTQQQMLKKAEQPHQPEDAEAADKPKDTEGLSGLLQRLDFASIERRGKPTD
jgi:uncharacterized protein